jgi:hypothetical protein
VTEICPWNKDQNPKLTFTDDKQWKLYGNSTLSDGAVSEITLLDQAGITKLQRLQLHANSSKGTTLADTSKLFTIYDKNEKDIFRIEHAGKVYAKNQIQAPTFNAQAYTSNSDKRLKENIKSFEYKKSILDLPVYTFDYITGPKNTIGCIAQELQEICPEIVSENENGYLSIQESKLVYLLLEEIKKLNTRISKLEKE